MLLNDKQRAGLAPSIAYRAVEDAIAGYGMTVEDAIALMPVELGPVYECERLLRKLAKRKRVRLPMWHLGRSGVPKDGKDGALYWAVTDLLWFYQSAYLYGPHIEALVEVASSADYGLLIEGQPAEILRGAQYPSERLTKLIEDLLNELIKKFAAKEFQNIAAHRMERVAGQEAASIRILQAALGSQLTNELMIVSLDHVLPGPLSVDQGKLVSAPGYNPDVAIADLVESRRRYSRRLSDHGLLKGKLVGWLQFLSGGPVPGPYIHCIYFFEAGSIARQDAVNALSKLWKKHTGGVGLTHSVRSHHNPFKLQTGTKVSARDADSMRKVERALVYLTSKSLYFAPKTKAGGHTFWHSDRAWLDEEGGGIQKQRSAVERRYSSRRKPNDLAPHAKQLLPEVESTLRNASKAKKPTTAEKFLSDTGMSSAIERHKFEQEAFRAALLQRTLIDRDVADANLDRRAATRFGADVNPAYLDHINSKTNRFSEHCRAAEPSDGAPDSAPDIDNIPTPELVANADLAPEAATNSVDPMVAPPSVEGNGKSLKDRLAQQRKAASYMRYAPSKIVKLAIVQARRRPGEARDEHQVNLDNDSRFRVAGSADPRGTDDL